MPVKILGYTALAGGVALFLGALGWSAPLSDAMTIGGDDMFELCKAQLLNRRPELAGLMWNDQPWLHTVLIAQLFSMFGEDAAFPRLFSLACTFGMVLACWRILGPAAGGLERVFFAGYLFTATQVLTLATSAMVELPAMAVALVAVALLNCDGEGLPKWRGYVAGFVLAAAVFIKLTALMIGPGLMCYVLLQRRSVPLKEVIPRCALGALACGLLVAGISPATSLNSLWLTHWQTRHIAWDSGGLGFVLTDVINDVTIMLAACLGVAGLAMRRFTAPTGVVFALVWLLTCICVHSVHRPWFGYYALHFHVPIAMLAACGAGWVTRHAWNGISPNRTALATPVNAAEYADFGAFVRRCPSSYSVAAILASIIVSGWFGVRLPTALEEVTRIQASDTESDSRFVSAIRRYGDRASWLYASDNTLAFHGGVLQPPELIVMSYKRSALGDIDRDKIFRIVRSYEPELLLLRRDGELADDKFRTWLTEARYVRVTWSGSSDLWVAPRLSPEEARRPEELVKDLGL